MNKTAWVALSIAGVIALLAVILSGGGSPTTNQDDVVGDVAIGEGTGEPGDVTIADITHAVVSKNGDEVVFEVTVSAELPRKLKGSILDLRWDVSVGGTDTWIVAANLNDGPNASITSLKSNYGSSTIDGTLPGSVALTGDTLTVTVDAAQVDGFPTTFTWRLMSTLDGDPADPGSATATDTAPDSGPGELE